jgi:hypothetical protein
MSVEEYQVGVADKSVVEKTVETRYLGERAA